MDDKIAVANEEGVDYLEVANRNIDDYFRCMDSLNVIRADAYPRVTETIPDIIEMISQLLDKGHAYEADDGAYFEIDTSPEKYGLLTGQTLDMVRAGAGGGFPRQGQVRGTTETLLLEISESWRACMGKSLGRGQAWMAH